MKSPEIIAKIILADRDCQVEEFVLLAQAYLDLLKEIEDAPTVVCRKDDGKWACDEHPGFARADHTAKLLRPNKI